MTPPREVTISVGGVDVHAWTGGQGDPLLVLHGAGGNRGFTRWLRQVAERYSVWAPTHSGFGASGDADWMETVDDLARFYLWFVDAAGLGRPHLLGQSLGGWTAAEMAAMAPGAIDRLVLVSPAGLKPEAGEILDVFYQPAAQLRAMTVHDPATIPEWDELYGRPPTPAELEIATRNQEMAEHFIVAGTADDVADTFAMVHEQLGIGHLLLEAQESRMDHATTTRSIELMGATVIPATAKLG